MSSSSTLPNRKPPASASTSSDSAWQTRDGLDLPRLVDLWRRSDTELRALVKGSAMTRAKLTGLRRNVAVAIGNSGDQEAIDELRRDREDQPSAADPMVRAHIDWALQTGGPEGPPLRPN